MKNIAERTPSPVPIGPAQTSRHRSRTGTRIFTALIALLLPNLAGLHAGEATRQCAPQRFDSTEKILLSSLPGSLLYIDFWASWCGPCKQSFPFMNALKKRFESQGVTVVAISVDKELDEARSFLKDNPATFLVAHDPGGRCAKEFAVKGMPSSYIVSKTGGVLYTHKGFRPSDTEAIAKQIDVLIKNQ